MCGNTRLGSVLIAATVLVTAAFAGCAVAPKEPVSSVEAPEGVPAVSVMEQNESEEAAPGPEAAEAEEVAPAQEAGEAEVAPVQEAKEAEVAPVQEAGEAEAAEVQAEKEQQERAEKEKEAAAIVAEVVELCEQEKFEEALANARVLKEKGLEEYLPADELQRLEQCIVAIFEATGESDLLSEDQKEELAEELFEKGMEAYKQKRYADAKSNLDKVAQLNVSLGWWDNRSLRKARERVNSVLFDLQERYVRGQRLYEVGNYAEAKGEFMAIKESGIKCGAEIDKGVEEYLADIDAKINEQLLREAKDYEGAIAELDEHIEKALAARNREARLYEQVMSKWADAAGSWEAGDFEEAKALLLEVQETLKDFDIAKYPELQEKAEDIRQKLAVVDDRIAGKKMVAELLGEARKLYPEALFEAEKKVLEAQGVAMEQGVPLSEQDRQFCQGVMAEARRALAERYALKRVKYWPLMGESDEYIQMGEYGLAREALRLIEQAGELGLTDEQKEMLAAKVALVEERLQNEQRLLEAVSSLEEEAAELVEAGKPEEAAEKLAKALSVVRNEGLPNSVLLRVLESYEAVLSKVIPARIERRIGRAKEQAIQKLEMLQELKPCLKAEYYLAAGSPDLAKAYLEVVVADKEKFGEERVRWAQEKLRGIDAEIARLEAKELLNTRDALAEVYRLEKDLLEKVQAQEEVDLDEWGTKIADAKLRLQVARLEQLLERGAYPTAAEVIAGTHVEEATPELVDEKYKPLVVRVRNWQNAGYLLKEAEKALESWQLKQASEALDEVENIKADLGALTEVYKQLRAAFEAAQQAIAQETSISDSEMAELEKVRSELAMAKQREKAYELYSSARAAYLAEEWDEAYESLLVLRSLEGLYDFELEAANRMFAECSELLAEKHEAIAEAQKVLDAAQSDFDSAFYAQAAEKLDSLAGSKGLKLDPKLAERAEALAEKLAEKEKEAEELYRSAVEASKSKDFATLRNLLTRLKTDYRHTKTFRLHQ